jgi:hypothetical protein
VRDPLTRLPVTARAGETLGAFMDETAGVSRHAVHQLIDGSEVSDCCR